ncbi:molybdate ABC transporter substrate-binding protein [Actinomadura livida]|uniref:Molybdate ABC transporter substrate-binding protein n=1 Tax=Actinomadura livida TaxID=79909 RepID=A0A7W7IGN9_9ACTN|nr:MULTISPECIES: molybdate ABC transporter substrate-binding protein [Actinomadura]MBB4776754.1 molybdate transport system substrate-binding protein [Actinomadura catellatispora]GGT94610.1 molybdate-binding protein [Actinomadura livida]
MPDSPRRRRLRASTAPLASLALLLPVLGAGCGGSSRPATLTVLATSSMKEVFGEMGTAYRHAHPGVRLRFEFGAMPEMADRLTGQDRGDVLVTADMTSMKEADDYLVGRRRVVAHDSLTIAVGPGNPYRIRGLSDLAGPRLRVVVGAETVPVGRYTGQVFTKAGLTVRSSSKVISARAVLDRVRAGEADAGLVFLTDLRSAGIAVSSVPIPADLNVTAAFAAATVRDTDHQEEADAFVAWLTTAPAQAVFHKHGFALPPASR